VGEYDQGDITSPFSVKDIKVTHATVMLPTIINRLKREEIGIPDYLKNSNPLRVNVCSTKKLLIVEILCKPSITIHFSGSLTSK
jgi:hypothetical protein